MIFEALFYFSVRKYTAKSFLWCEHWMTNAKGLAFKILNVYIKGTILKWMSQFTLNFVCSVFYRLPTIPVGMIF